MAKIVPHPPPPAKWELPDDPHTRKLPFARAIQAATYGRRAAIGARLHKSASLLEAYGDPERANVPPNQRLAELVLVALAEGIEPHDALEPLRHLNAIFGLEVTPTLPVLGTIGVDAALGAVMRECGEAFATVAESLPNGVSAFEATRCKKELRDVRARLDQIEAELDAIVAAHAAG